MVPQRPARSQNHQSAPAQNLETPMVPPRPSSKTARSRSPSADREAYARSPLNLPYNVPPPMPETLFKKPSMQNLPQIGQEGMEYASFDQAPEDAKTHLLNPHLAAPNELRTIAHDLPLHAPKASTTSTVSRDQVDPVVRTDSTKAASVGIGKSQTEYDVSETSPRPPSAARQGVALGRPASTASHELHLTRTVSRPESMQDKDHDIG